MIVLFVYLCSVKRYRVMKVNIKEVAKRHGVSVSGLAERMNVSRQTVHYYCEQGDRNPLGQLERIAEAIGVPVYELFSEPETDELRQPGAVDPQAVGDFVALVREGGRTYSFDSREELSSWLAGGEN